MSKKTKLGIATFCGIFCLGAFWAGSALKTKATAGPVISSVSASVSGNTVSIYWKTDISVTAKVEYGTTSKQYTESKAITTSATSFSVHINDLQYETTYYYRISATDLNGNTTNSSEYTFATSAKELKITYLDAISISSDKAVVLLTTNKVSNSTLKYGTSANSLTETADRAELVAGFTGNTEWHFILTDLKTETTYYYQTTSVRAQDWQGENETLNSEVKSFKTTGLAKIESISPTSGPIGTELTILGKNFGNEAMMPGIWTDFIRRVAIGCSDGYYSTCLAQVISWNNEKIVAKVAKGVKTGNVYLQKYLNVQGISKDIFTIKGPVFTLTSGVANTNVSTANHVSEAYGCKYSTTTKDSSTVQVPTLFTKGSATDNYLRSVYDAYYAAWSRYPRCDELQFQLDHSTPIETLKSWLAQSSITEKYGCKYSTTVSDENTVRLTALFKLDSEMDKYLNSVYNAYFEAWGRYPRCDELEFQAVHSTPIEKLKTWLSENKPEVEVTEAPKTVNESLEQITGQKFEFIDNGSKLLQAYPIVGLTEKDQITFFGKTLVNSVVVITVTSEPSVYTTKSDKDGNWFYILPGPLILGDHSVQVKVLDENSNIVKESNTIGFPVEPEKTKGSKTSLVVMTFVIIVALVLILFTLVLTKKRKIV